MLGKVGFWLKKSQDEKHFGCGTNTDNSVSLPLTPPKSIFGD